MKLKLQNIQNIVVIVTLFLFFEFTQSTLEETGNKIIKIFKTIVHYILVYRR